MSSRAVRISAAIVLSIALTPVVVLAEHPSPARCVRACPPGKMSENRLWNGISPLVREWELAKREEALSRIGKASGTPPADPRLEISCLLPKAASRPVAVFLADDSCECIPTNSISARGYALVRWFVTGSESAVPRASSRALDWVEAHPELDATRVAAVGRTALEAAACDERFAMAATSGCEGDASARDGGDLLCLVAPRLAFVSGGAAAPSAVEAARTLYAAYGLPERLGYLRHERPHRMCADDWEKIMDFADRHLKAPSTADSDAIAARVSAACADGSRLVTLARNAASPDGVWRLTRAIVLPDDFTLVFDGCRVELADGTQDNLVRNAGAAEGACVPNRGIRILGRNGAVLSGGTRNHYLPRRSGDPNGWRSVGILLCDVSDYEIGGFSFEETQCWAISQERCHRGRVHDIAFGSSDIMFNQDGIDLRKGCHDITIENISGTTGDDAVALTAYRDPPGSAPHYGMQIGGNAYLGERDDVYNVTIRNIRARSAGGHGVIRLLVCDGIRMHHIKVENVVDTAVGDEKRPQATIRLGDTHYHKIRPCRMGEMHHVEVRNVRASGSVAVWMKGPLCDSTVVGIESAPGGKRYDITAPLERVELDK